MGRFLAGPPSHPLPAPEPRPWLLYEQGEANQFCILNATGKRWVLGLIHNGEFLGAKQEANLRFMVAAANCHDQLLAALVFARDEIAMRIREDGGTDYSVIKACRPLDQAIAAAHAALNLPTPTPL